MSKDWLEKMNKNIFMTIIIGLPSIKLLSYILLFLGVVKDSFVINQVYLLWVLVPLLIGNYLIGILTKKYKFTYIDYLMYFLVLFAVFATIFAYNREVAVFGEKWRYEGLLSILSYYFIFLNIKNMHNEKYKKQIIDTILYVALFQAIYGFLQVYTTLPFIKHYSKGYMAMSLCGNPNFFGSYILLPLMISMGHYLKDGGKKNLVFTIIFYLSLVTTQSTGPFLTSIITFILMVLIFGKNFKLTRILIVVLIFVGGYFFIDKTTNYAFTKRRIIPEEAYMISTELKNRTGDVNTLSNGRVEVWKRTIPLVKKYWFMGAGLDNFQYVYPYNTRREIFDKAHNVYLQIGVTNGVIVLGIYLLICFIAFLNGFKFKKGIDIGIYSAFIAYSIQAFANISVIDVAPIYFMILGLIYTKKEAK